MMKTRDTFIRLSAALSLSAAGLMPLSASVAVVSNLGSEGDEVSLFRDSHGAPLAAGCQVQLVTFGYKTAEEVAAMAATGPSGLLASATLFGAAATIATGSGEPGMIEFETSAPLSAPLGGLHAIIFNAATPDSATELLVVSLPGELQADSLSGLEGYFAVHFDDAAVVFGERTEAGFSAQPFSVVVPSAFDEWIVAQLGEESLPSDRLAGADPDRDGVGNLLEYAMGSHAADGSSRASLHLRRAENGVIFVQYVRRTDDPGLSFHVEQGTALEAGPWMDLESSESLPVEPPFPAPAGCEWVEQALPANGKGFARLNVAMDAETP